LAYEWAAGDLQAAFDWHMRAGAWTASRDIAAARVSWERARQIADELPIDDTKRTAMRIATRTMLCGTAWRGDYLSVSRRIEELRELCTAAGDKASLAIAVFGLAGEHMLYGRVREGSRLFAEQIALGAADPEELKARTSRVSVASGRAAAATGLTNMYFNVEGRQLDPITNWNTVTQPKPLLEPENITDACDQMVGRLGLGDLIAKAEAEAPLKSAWHKRIRWCGVPPKRCGGMDITSRL
jgi:hypothetical protein